MTNYICCVKQKQKAYEKICKYIDENLYFFYAILCVLVIGCCFIEEFAYITVFYLFALAVFINIEQIFCLILFLTPFVLPFKIVEHFSFAFENVPIAVLASVGGVKYAISLIKKKTKPNFFLVATLVLFLIYVILPIHETSTIKLAKYFVFATIVFLAYENRKQIKLKKLVFFFCAGIIISCALSMLQPISQRLQNIDRVFSSDGVNRFKGLRQHPNQLGLCCSLGIIGLMVVELKKQIKIQDFFILFLSISIFGVLTLSRNFVFASAICTLIFLISYAIMYKKKVLPFIYVFLCLFVLLMLPFKQTKTFFKRFANSLSDMKYDEKIIRKGDAGYSDEWWQKVLNGEVTYDPGRLEIAKNYMDNWSSSAKTIIFGRGSAAPYIGKMSAHNFWIQELWYHGALGYLLYIAIICSMIDFKKQKKTSLLQILSLCTFMIPVLFATIIEASFDNSFFIVGIVLASNSFRVESNVAKHKNNKSRGM